MNYSNINHQNKRTVRVIVLGSTGSIGVNTLQVIAHLNGLPCAKTSYEVVGLAGGRNDALLYEQADRFGCEDIAIANPKSVPTSHDGQLNIFIGEDSALRLVEEVDCDLIVGAIVGIAGLPAVVAGIRKGCDIALANKETLVAGGEIVMPLAAERGVSILPVDSEHSAIFQCLQSQTDHHDRGHDAIRKIILTASGGPFRTWTAARTACATVEETLNHPTWNMGAKVTVDSASLTNKALEMIEAHHLFGVNNDRIDVLVHPQSLVHGLVEFTDGSVMAQIGSPDMRTPIQYALTYPERPEGCSTQIDWGIFSSLEFEQVDVARFPAVNIGRRVIEVGGSSGVIFNAANEVAVEAYLREEIAFGQLTALAEKILDQTTIHPIGCIEDVLEVDCETRRIAHELLNDMKRRSCASKL